MASITYSEKMAKNGVKMPYTRNCEDFIFEWLTNDEFLTELKENGYDVSTFKFSIQRGKKSQNKPLWKEDYQTYLNDLKSAKKAILNDKAWVRKQEQFNTTATNGFVLDVEQTIENCCFNYWATEAGWNNKKSKKIKDINWKATFVNTWHKYKVYKKPTDKIKITAKC
jgi:hypothetical protein